MLKESEKANKSPTMRNRWSSPLDRRIVAKRRPFYFFIWSYLFFISTTVAISIAPDPKRANPNPELEAGPPNSTTDSYQLPRGATEAQRCVDNFVV